MVGPTEFDGTAGEELLRQAVTWVEKAYPCEGCGLVLEADGDLRFVECENLADKYHAVDPETYPRTSRDFYLIDPREFMKADERGERVAVIVHSHPDVGDYFSDEDVAAATMPRMSKEEPLEPVYPGTDYLVVSVRGGRTDGASLFRFDEEVRGFAAVRRWTAADLGLAAAREPAPAG